MGYKGKGRGLGSTSWHRIAEKRTDVPMSSQRHSIYARLGGQLLGFKEKATHGGRQRYRLSLREIRPGFWIARTAVKHSQWKKASASENADVADISPWNDTMREVKKK